MNNRELESFEKMHESVQYFLGRAVFVVSSGALPLLFNLLESGSSRNKYIVWSSLLFFLAIFATVAAYNLCERGCYYVLASERFINVSENHRYTDIARTNHKKKALRSETIGKRLLQISRNLDYVRDVSFVFAFVPLGFYLFSI